MLATCAQIAAIARRVTAAFNIVGDIDETGTIVQGSGFTTSRVETGEYVLTFDEAFIAPPVVVAVAQSYGVCYVPTSGIGAASVRIKCLSDLLGTAPIAANTRFSFFAACVRRDARRTPARACLPCVRRSRCEPDSCRVFVWQAGALTPRDMRQ